MFFSKLFVLLAFALLANQPFSNAVKDSRNCRLIQVPLAIQQDEGVSMENPESYYVYIVTNGRDYYVGKGIGDQRFQALYTTGTLLHLIDEGKQILYSKTRQEGTACMEETKLETLTKTLDAGEQVSVYQILPLTTEGRALFNQALLFRLLKKEGFQPNMNNYVPIPDLEKVFTADQLDKLMSYIGYRLSKAVSNSDQIEVFNSKRVLTLSEPAFVEFKNSPLYKSGAESFESKAVEAAVSARLAGSDPVRAYWALCIAQKERSDGYRLSATGRLNVLQEVNPDKSTDLYVFSAQVNGFHLEADDEDLNSLTTAFQEAAKDSLDQNTPLAADYQFNAAFDDEKKKQMAAERGSQEWR